MHLSYCTNVHPAEDLAGIVAQLDAYAVPIRGHLGADVLGLGLWLAAPAARALAEDAAARRRLRTEIASRGLEVVTLNGFPYRAFSAPVVKRAVYNPDWTTRDRLGYTLDLARVLVDLLPDGADRGSVSTLPLAWREPWSPGLAASAARLLDELAAGLAALARQTGRIVRVGFEPEPGCVVENTAQAVEHLSGVDTEWLGICLDLAHLAVAWEEPAAALAHLRGAGLPVVKVQLSAAIEAADPAAAADVLSWYVEPRYLHQTRNPLGDAADDLDEALAGRMAGPWRVHYHVPLHAAPAPPLVSTVPLLRAALRELVRSCDHFDVETYTWSVLPAEQRPANSSELARGIAAELSFARAELAAAAASTASGRRIDLGVVG